jgi:hypothetical protein
VSDRWHVCPGPECEIRLPSHVLACSTHWYRLPAELRSHIRRAWNAQDLIEHRRAVRFAVEVLRAEEAMPQV